MRRREYLTGALASFALGWMPFSFLFLAAPAIAQQEEKSNMELVGYNDLQGRSGYQIAIQRQGDRWIAYIGAQAGKEPQLNSLTGKTEPSGTSIVDVTDPRRPNYIAHIPGELIQDEGGLEHVRACSGSELPHGDKNKFYLLRNFGQIDQEMWDVTDPAKPSRLSVIVNYGDRPHDIHNSWWECDTGIAYLVAGPLDWPVPPKGRHNDAGEHVLIYDLSNPATPIFVRSFGLPGQEPGSAVPPPLGGLHGLLSTGPKGNRVYFCNSNDGDGIVEIVDREKLLNGPKVPTDESLRYPVVGRIEFPPDVGAEMSFPLYQMQLPEFARQKDGFAKNFLAVMGEGHFTGCQESRQTVRMIDVTTESKPVGVSTWTVPEASGNFCSRGGSFGTHSTNESFTAIYFKRILFIAHFNAGVRALDIRDPYNPKEIGYYIPAVTGKTRESCYGEGANENCKKVIQTVGVEVDDRGFIYIVDKAHTGMQILELAGPARQVADFSELTGK
jgi:hypothetical protein